MSKRSASAAPHAGKTARPADRERPSHPSRADLPIEVQGSGASPLGMPAADFLRDYWQKRPLLIRNAFPGFESPLSP